MKRTSLTTSTSLNFLVSVCILLVLLLFANEDIKKPTNLQVKPQECYLDAETYVQGALHERERRNFHLDKGRENNFSTSRRRNITNKYKHDIKHDVNSSIQSEKERSARGSNASKKAESTKYILYYYGRVDGWMPHKHINLSTCPVSDCVLTTNRTLLGSISDFDAVVVQKALYDIVRDGKRLLIPDQSKRKPHQRYIYYQLNTSQYLYRNRSLEYLQAAIKKVKNIFNWTMTFRLDSDFPIPYGWIDPIDGPIRGNPPNIGELPYKWLQYDNSEIIWSYRNKNKSLTKIASKPKTIAWLVSHKKARSFRYQYVQKLKKYIDVDIYGKLGHFCGHKHSEDCSILINEEYKFYLSFENSLCDYYISEKFWRAMTWDVIPIVLGDGNYDEVAPPHSHINVKDFATPKDLADYIIYLNDNDEEYLSYFWWKPHYRVEIGANREYHFASHRLAVCDMCRRLHDPQESLNQIEKFEELLTCRRIHVRYWRNRNNELKQ